MLKTHSRPSTSTDNPYSEAQFKTLKYRPEFPDRFDSIEHARAFCRVFFDWYNQQHRHSGIGLMTPAAVHHGHAQELHARRARVLETAYATTPERFVRRPPTPPRLPTAVWINKPPTEEVAHQIRRPTVSFDLTGSGEGGESRGSGVDSACLKGGRPPDCWLGELRRTLVSGGPRRPPHERAYAG